MPENDSKGFVSRGGHRKTWTPDEVQEKISKNSEKFKKFQKILKKIHTLGERAREFPIETLPIEGEIVSPPSDPGETFIGARGVLEQTELRSLALNPQAPLLVQRAPNVRLTPMQYLLEVVQTEPSDFLLPDQILWFEGRRQQAAIALLPFTAKKKGLEAEDEGAEGSHEAWMQRLAPAKPRTSSPEPDPDEASQ
jgi:hypothetical protein